MLKLRSFWILTAIFLLFSISVLFISINLWQHNEQKLLDHAIKAYTETAKYISKSIEEKDQDELHDELKHNHLKLACLSQKCEIPDGFNPIDSVFHKGDRIEIFKNQNSEYGLKIKTSSVEAFLIGQDRETPKHFKIVAVLLGLSTLMGMIYILSIINLQKTEKIKDILNQKEEFLYTISHEIKTPIAKAKLALEFMPDGEKKEIAKNSLRHIDSLSTMLLNNELKNSECATVLMSHIVQSALGIVIENQKCSVTIIKDFELECNVAECSVAIKNLIENGINHSTNNLCEIEINNNYIKVKSRGEMIQEDINELIEPFLKGEKSKGFGLGLYIVSKITQRNDLALSKEYESGINIFTLSVK